MQRQREYAKKLAQSETFHFPSNLYCPLVMKAKRTLTPVKVGPRNRAKSAQSQKKDIEAINNAFKRKIGEDGYRSQGAFGRKHVP
jgi:hypothetical protein